MNIQVGHRCRELLISQSLAMDVTLTDTMVDQLLAYVQLMHRWNRTYNLTAVKNMLALVSRHVIDSFTVLPFLNENTTLLDVGTGAGLPGLPLAIVRPDLKVGLLDSNGKKICFLRQVINDLGVQNVTLHQHRVEQFQPEKGYHYVVSRAFSSLANLLDAAQHLCVDDGKILAMKGMYPSAELAEISVPYSVHDIVLPDDALVKRHMVVIDLSKNKADLVIE